MIDVSCLLHLVILDIDTFSSALRFLADLLKGVKPGVCSVSLQSGVATIGPCPCIDVGVAVSFAGVVGRDTSKT